MHNKTERQAYHPLTRGNLEKLNHDQQQGLQGNTPYVNRAILDERLHEYNQQLYHFQRREQSHRFRGLQQAYIRNTPNCVSVQSLEDQWYPSTQLWPSGYVDAQQTDEFDMKLANDQCFFSYPDSQRTVDDDLKLYVQRHSAESPMQRFATLEAANDPNAYVQRIALKDMAMELGDMSKAEARQASARFLVDVGAIRAETEDAQNGSTLGSKRTRRSRKATEYSREVRSS
ncbi:MAG: hypothetical protein M1827_004203 [Pycnora praestabilis]|nr:MAG: hypothetical protein M1827_004203 [Pycnora praestabilis]